MCDCDAFGLLQPLAYAPCVTNGPVLDMLVTAPLRAGAQLSFRFYPQSDSYLSAYSTTVSFVLATALLAGTFLRLNSNALSSTMALSYRARSGASWNLASATSSLVTYAPNNTCYIFAQRDSPVAAIGLITPGTPTLYPIFPPVLPSQYTVQAGNSSVSDQFVYFQGVNPFPYLGIPSSWKNAWKTIRPTSAWGVGSVVPSSDYDADVTAVEDALYIQLQPTQLVPIAFRPYGPATPGAWCVLVTASVPKDTTMYITANNYGGYENPWFVWNSGPYDIACGTVISFGGLGGTNVPTVSAGTVATLSPGYDNSVSIDALTAWYYPNSGSYFMPDTSTITGTYTADYYGAIPVNLTLGVAIRPCLWPSGASIVVSTLACAQKECSPTAVAVKANNTPLQKWICQTAPTSFPICRTPCPC